MGFELVLWARTLTFNEWAEALQVGAFDVLDVLCDLPKAAEGGKTRFGVIFPEALLGASRTSVV